MANVPNFRKIRLAFKLVASYLGSNLRLFLISFSVGLVVIYLFPKLSGKIFARRPESIGLVGNYTISTLPLSIQKKISYGLTRLSPNGQATQAAALEWQTTDSGKLVEFSLDPSLFWQDGTKFDATQINYNLRGVKMNKLSLSKVQFELTEPFAPLPTIVSQPLFKNGLIGLGQNKVSAISFNGRFLASLTLVDQSTRKRVIYKFFPKEETALTALKLGTVDEVEEIHDTRGLEGDKRYQSESSTRYDLEVVLFYNLRSKTLEDKTVRQGLTYALPDQYGTEEIANSPISKTNWAYSNHVKEYPVNPELGEKMVGRTGSQSGQLKLVLVTERELEPTARNIANSWEKIGVKTEMVVSDVTPNFFDAYLTYVELPPDPDQYALWHSTQTGNVSGYKSARVDRLLEDGRKILNTEERRQIYANFQRAITEDVPATFLFYPKVYMITRT